MSRIKAIIIDDERPARKEMQFLLKSFSEILLIGEADNIADAVTLIQTQKPDIVFLDIQLTGENGFDLLQKVAIDFKIIFVTAYDEYAIKAFDVNASDYLLKPVDPARLEKSLKRIFNSSANNHNSTKKFDYEDSIYVKLNNYTAKFVELKTIVLFSSIGNYSKLETIDGNSYLILKTLKQWEEELPSCFFIRINRSSIVNIKYVIRIENYRKSNHKVYLKHIKESLEISRYYFKNFKKVNKDTTDPCFSTSYHF